MNSPNIYFSIIAEDRFSDSFKKATESTKKLKTEHKKTTENIQKENNKISSSFESVAKSIASTFLGISAMKKGFSDYAYLDKFIQKIGIIGHVSDSGLKSVKEQILSVSSLTGMGATELAKAGSILATAQIPIDKYKEYLMSITNIQKGAREDLQSSDVATFMAVVKKNFPKEEAQSMSDSIAWMLEKVPNINFLELSNSLGRSSAQAKELNISMKELLAVESGMIVDQGGARASTQMANLLKTLRANKNEIEKGFQVKIDFSKEGGLINFLNDVAFKFKDITDEQVKIKKLQDILGTGEVSNTMLYFLDNLQESNKLFRNLNNEAQGFAESGAKRMDNSAIDEYGKILVTIENSFLKIGEIVSKLKIPKAFLVGLTIIENFLGILSDGLSAIGDGMKFITNAVPVGLQDFGNIFKSEKEKEEIKQKNIEKAKKLQDSMNIRGTKYEDLSLENKALLQRLPERQEMQSQAFKNIFTEEKFRIAQEEKQKIKLENQEIKIVLENQGNSQIAIKNINTTNNDSKIEIQKRNFLNK